MISEVDINDWEMLSEPVTLKNLNKDDVFTFGGLNQLLQLWWNHNGNTYAGIFGEPPSTIYCLPDHLNVYKCIQK